MKARTLVVNALIAALYILHFSANRSIRIYECTVSYFRGVQPSYCFQ